jgi:hypothetical protein
MGFSFRFKVACETVFGKNNVCFKRRTNIREAVPDINGRSVLVPQNVDLFTMGTPAAAISGVIRERRNKPVFPKTQLIGKDSDPPDPIMAKNGFDDKREAVTDDHEGDPPML